MSAARPYCEDCKRSFVDAAALFQHRRYRHLNGERRRAEAEAAAPYPFCTTPDQCAGKGYCPKEIACND